MVKDQDWWRDEERARQRSQQLHRLRAERINGRARRRHRIVAGLILGSMGYLVTSCYFEQRLHKPKIERVEFNFKHGPQ